MIAIAYYLLKVFTCSGILFLYYHAALKNKAFHQWNRFYLLFAVLLSLLLPLVQFTIFHTGEDESKAIQLIQVMQSADIYIEAFTDSAPSTLSPEQWVFSGYLLISFLLFSSLLISLSAIFSLLKKHTISIVQNIKFVGTKEPGTPFSFLNYIFWNDAISLQSQTGQQIFQHELVHVKERHTLDKLFMQIVLILFWVNPFFWLVRRELKFIHEFIADKKAVGEYGADAFVAMILQTAYPQHYHNITNQFFQTSIKRRLLMLTKIQSPRRAYISRIIVLPIIALTVIIFSFRTKPISTPGQISQANQAVAGTEQAIDFHNFLRIANDTPPPKSNKEIRSVDVRTKKEITINYADGTSETLTENEASKRGLINNGGYGNEKPVGKINAKGSLRLNSDGPKPLFIVDGKETTELDLSKTDPNLIESINVLKDKSATDKYGDKGTNGVVEITMKGTISNTPVTLLDNDKPVLKGNITKLEINKKNQIDFEADSIVVEAPVKQNKIFTKAEEPASIDQNVWGKFLGQKLQPILENLSSTKAEGKLIVNLQFIVNTDGGLSDVKALNDPGYGIVPKVIEMMQYSPRWTPAKQNGRTVRSVHTQPITLLLAEKRTDPSVTKSILQKPNATPEQIKQMTLHQLAGLNPTDDIVSLVLTIDNEYGDIVISNIKGNELNEPGKKIIHSAAKGRTLTVEQIRIKKDGMEKKIGTRVYIM